MFIMAFAGGLAYDYNNYVSRIATHQGSLRQVFNDTIKTFKKDSRLIKPKKFGFDSYHLEEIELRPLPGFMERNHVEIVMMEKPRNCIIE